VQQINKDVIDTLYSAGPTYLKWQTALDQLYPLVNAKSAGLIVIENAPDGALQQHHFGVATSNVNPERLAEYNKHFAQYDQSMLAISRQYEPGTLLIDPAFQDVEVISQRPDVAFGIQHFGVRDRFGVRLNDDAAWQDAVAFQYDTGRTNVTPEEFAALQIYIPHMAQSIVLGRIYEQIRQKYNAVLTMLDRVAIGMMLLGSDATVILSNSYARQAIDSSAALKIDQRGRLKVSEGRGEEFSHMVAKVTDQSSLPGAVDRHMLAVDKSADGDRLLLEVSPLTDAQSELGVNQQLAIVIIIDPTAPMQFDKSALKHLYGLSPSELEVASLVGHGYSQPDIAESRNVSSETIKKQVSSVFSKMKTNSRAGLMRRLMSIRLPFVN